MSERQVPEVRAAVPADAQAIADIYNHYVTNTTVTFEESPVSAQGITSRMAEVATARLPWLIVEADGRVAGYAYASRWKSRCAYRFSSEITAYVDQMLNSRGLGSALYRQLFAALRERGIHAVLAGIALPNPASIAFHEKFGLEKVAHMREVGYKFGRWIDVGYWHRLL